MYTQHHVVRHAYSMSHALQDPGGFSEMNDGVTLGERP